MKGENDSLTDEVHRLTSQIRFLTSSARQREKELNRLQGHLLLSKEVRRNSNESSNQNYSLSSPSPSKTPTSTRSSRSSSPRSEVEAYSPHQDYRSMRHGYGDTEEHVPCRDDYRPTPTERKKKPSLPKSAMHHSASQRLETLAEFTGQTSRKHSAPNTPRSSPLTQSSSTTPKPKKLKARVLFKSPKSSKASHSESSDTASVEKVKQQDCHLQ